MAAALATVGTYLCALLCHHHGRPAEMLRVGSRSGQLAGLAPARLDAGSAATPGFDGQFFLVLTVIRFSPPRPSRPWTRPGCGRIGLPLFGAALGAAGLGPAWGLLLAEALAGLGLIAVVQAAAWRQGISRLWCFAVPLCLPFALSLKLVTSGPDAARRGGRVHHCSPTWRFPARVSPALWRATPGASSSCCRPPPS